MDPILTEIIRWSSISFNFSCRIHPSLVTYHHQYNEDWVISSTNCFIFVLVVCDFFSGAVLRENPTEISPENGSTILWWGVYYKYNSFHCSSWCCCCLSSSFLSLFHLNSLLPLIALSLKLSSLDSLLENVCYIFIHYWLLTTDWLLLGLPSHYDFMIYFDYLGRLYIITFSTIFLHFSWWFDGFDANFIYTTTYAPESNKHPITNSLNNKNTWFIANCRLTLSFWASKKDIVFRCQDCDKGICQVFRGFKFDKTHEQQ